MFKAKESVKKPPGKSTVGTAKTAKGRFVPEHAGQPAKIEWLCRSSTTGSRVGTVTTLANVKEVRSSPIIMITKRNRSCRKFRIQSIDESRFILYGSELRA